MITYFGEQLASSFSKPEMTGTSQNLNIRASNNVLSIFKRKLTLHYKDIEPLWFE